MTELIEVGKLTSEVLFKAGFGSLTVEDFEGDGALLSPRIRGCDHDAAGSSAQLLADAISVAHQGSTPIHENPVIMVERNLPECLTVVVGSRNDSPPADVAQMARACGS